jgi:hypothetical protein
MKNNNETGFTEKILPFWRSKSTEEIIAIIKEQGKEHFTEETFEAIERVFRERGIDIQTLDIDSSVESNNIICSVCGTTNPPFVAFCKHCGGKISTGFVDKGLLIPKSGKIEGSTHHYKKYFAGLLLTIFVAMFVIAVFALDIRYQPILDLFQLVAKEKYDSKVAEITELNGRVATLNDQLSAAKREVVRLNKEVENAKNIYSLVCAESWIKFNNSIFWFFKEPYFSFMGKWGFQAIVTQWGTNSSLQPGDSDVLLWDLYKTKSMILNIDKDCVIVNPAWKKFD